MPGNVPKPLVKTPVLKRHGGVPGKPLKSGRGFSTGEISAVGLTIREARLLGLYVDERRKSIHEHNVKLLADWLQAIREGAAEPGEATLPKVVHVKSDPGKVFKGKTMAGRKARGLLSVKNRYTHHYKWKRKQRQRMLRKRHEASRRI